MVSGFVNDLIRGLGRRPVGDVRHLPRILRPRPGGLTRRLERDIARDLCDAPAVDLGLDLLEDDFSRVDTGPAWAPPVPPPMRTRDLIHAAQDLEWVLGP